MKVLVGKDDWLYLGNDTNHVVFQHQGNYLLDRDKLKLSAADRSSEQLDQAARRAVFVCRGPGYARDLSGILAEIDCAGENRPILQLRAALTVHGLSDLLVYPLDEIMAAKTLGLVCNKVDTHWTRLGAFIFYDAIVKRLAGFDGPKLTLEDFHHSAPVIVGDLGSKFQTARSAQTYYLKLKRTNSRTVYDTKVNNRGRITIHENQNANNCCVLLRDSYAIQLIDMLAESFGRLVTLHTTACDYDVLEQERPDFVIGELAERFLVQVPDDLRDPTTSHIAEEKLAKGQLVA